jgi:hypothetical protein
MHQPVKDNLEEYLRGVSGNYGRAIPDEMETHLNSCAECAGELSELELQSAALQSLRAPAGAELPAGFYARVMQRIDEARATNSVWAAFLEPIFAKRLFYASATLLFLLGSYLVSSETGDHGLYNPPPAVVSAPPDVAANATSDDVDTTPQERDAVLVSLASYEQ